jgi:hypothetical protein
MSAAKAKIEAVEDMSPVTGHVNEAQSPTFENLNEEEYIALEKKRKVPVLAKSGHLV